VARIILTALGLLLAVTCLAPAVSWAQDLPEGYEGPSPEAAIEALQYEPGLGPATDTGDELYIILTRDEFQGEAGRLDEETWIDKFFKWVNQLFGNRQVPVSQPGWGWIISVVIAGFLLIYLVTRFIWWVMGRRRERAGTYSGSEASERRLTPDGLLKLAGECASRGDHRSAVRYRYLALLKRLEMPDSPLRTNSQVMRWIERRYPAAGSGFGELVRCYEDTWYGGQPLSAAEYSRAGERAAGVESTVSAERERQAVAEQLRKERGSGQAE